MSSIKKNNDINQFLEIFRKNNLKVTPQRFAIYREIQKLDLHPTADEIFKRIRHEYPTISFDTVNRTLLTFADIGILSVVEGYGSPRRYDPDVKPHHHIHCVTCGQIFDYHSDTFDSLETPPEIKARYKILNKKVVINILCQDCQLKADS